MNITKKGMVLLISLGLISGIAATVGLQAHAAGTSGTATIEAEDTDQTIINTTTKGHVPLGSDGNITAIDGTTITMQEEADEGSISYTVDISNATITNNGINVAISSLKIGDKIFVQGTTNGANIVATSISLGHPNGKCAKVETESESTDE